jgi:ribosome maturation factor RimP
VASTETIRELAEPVLASAGLELWDVEIRGDVVRILAERRHDSGVDAAGSGRGVNLDALAAASSALSPVLDTHPDAAPDGRYQLEVSSPGIERTLRTPDQYRRYVDTDINVKTVGPVEGARRHRGRLVEVVPDGIVIRPDDAPDACLTLRYDQIDRARTVVVWGPGTGSAAHGRSTAGKKNPARTRAATGGATAVHNSKDAGS